MRNRIFRIVVLTVIGLVMASIAQAQTYTFSTLYSFKNNGKDPANPPFLVPAFLILGTDGNLYGTSSEGGTFGSGTVFKVAPTGQLSVLHSFRESPNSLARQSKQGNLFGTSVTTVFKLAPSTNGSYTFSTLYSNAAADIESGTVDSAGDFYGADEKCNPNACVFGIRPGKARTDLYHLGTQHSLLGNIIIRSPGDLYVSASYRGLQSTGWVQEIGGSFNTFSPTGTFPDSVHQDALGNIYGLATSDDPTTGIYANIFKIDTNGVLSTVYYFTDGSEPIGSFAVDSTGNVFGTAVAQDESGFVFKVTPSGEETVLQTFSAFTFNIGLVMDKTGNLYGVTSGSGGSSGSGSVYKLAISQ